MKLAELAATPQLTKITIDDEETVSQFGEAVEFWVYDRQDMDTFMKLASVTDDNLGEIVTIINEMVRDEDGNKILVDDKALPTSVMLKVIEEVVKTLGNLNSQTLPA